MFRCGPRMYARGLHELSCKSSAKRHPRHAALNDIIKWSQQSAEVYSNLEPAGVDKEDGNRPEGLFRCSHSATGEVCAGMTPAQHLCR